MGNLFSRTPPSRPLEVEEAPHGLALVVELYHGAPGARGFVAAVPGSRASPLALLGAPGAAAAVIPLRAAPGADAAPAAAVTPLRTAQVAVAAAFFGLFLRIPAGDLPPEVGIFLALPTAGLAFGLFVPRAPTGASASASASAGDLGPIPAGLSVGLGVPAATRGSERFPAVLPDSGLPAMEAEGCYASALQLGLAPAMLSDSWLPAAVEAPSDAPDAGTKESSAEGPPSGASSAHNLGPAPGAGLPTKVSNLVDIPEDCLFRILLSLSRRDLINTTLCCKALFSTISSSSFSQIYQLHHKYSPSALLCMFDRESLDTVALTLNEPVVLSLDFVKDKNKWTIIDSRDGLLLLLAQCDADSFLVCNPMTKKCADVPAPPDLPPLYSVLAAGLVPEANSSWSVIALFGCTVKSVSRKGERCWVGSFNATDGSWEGKHQEVKFSLPDSGWGNLPFERNVLRIHPHILGRNRMDELCLLMHDGMDLIVMSYGESSEASEVRRYSGFVFNMDLSFAEKNCMLLMDGLVCFDIELGDVLLPFMVNLEQRIENAVPYEMAWPPKPRLQHGVQMPEDRIILEEGAGVLKQAPQEP